MKFEHAVVKSVKRFLDGKMPINSNGLKEGGLIYTPDYFDQLEEQLVGKVEKEEE